jgi:hypothetical protein
MCLGVPVCLWGKRHFPIELLFSRVKNSKRHLQGDHSGVGIFCLVSFPPFLNGLRVSWDCRTARRALPDQLRSPAADQLRKGYTTLGHSASTTIAGSRWAR